MAAKSTLKVGSLKLKSDAKASVVKDTTRHCAFCLEIITAFPVKLCGGCKRRAYCSKKCQVSDWKDSGTGQRHKNWCGVHDHGEEDVDWEVVPVPNKGLGIVAKKFLPAGYRIIVEPVFTDPSDHPAINDLEPKGSPLFVKVFFNGFKGGLCRDGGKNLIGVRSSRLNHSCLPNAGFCYDDESRVEIVFAQQDILPGQEVTICYYTHFKNLGPSTVFEEEDQSSQNPMEDDFSENQSALEAWGITCPTDCFCKDPKTRKLILKGKRIFNEMHVSNTIGRLEDAKNAGEKLVKIYNQLDVSWVVKKYLLLYLCKIDIMSPESFSMRVAYLAELNEIQRVISPFCESTSACAEWLKTIRTKTSA